jgi:hypothetical protein
MAPPDSERTTKKDETMEIDLYRPDRVRRFGVPLWRGGDPAGIQHGRSTFHR